MDFSARGRGLHFSKEPLLMHWISWDRAKAHKTQGARLSMHCSPNGLSLGSF